MTVEIGRPGSFINRRFCGALSPLVEQLIELLDLKAAARAIATGREIVSEGRPCPAIYLVAEGVAIRYRILRDGQRQIVSVLLPGDFAGITSCRFDSALFSIRTLSPSVVYPIPLTRLAALADSRPQLAAQLFWSFANDSALVAEHLIAVGRRTALERLAHFLLELLTRLRRLGLAADGTFRLPLTQEIMGDALGLSIPYVNRVLRQLQDAGLILVKNQRFEIRNLEELAALADFRHDYLQPRPMPEPVATAH
ncbi:MAG: Crp/Fnr family transcriptional regulator [Alphaproteobacteria bacterium]